MTTTIEFELNGAAVRVDVQGHQRLIDVLRESLGHTGTKEGCGEGECGACTVLVDGRAINSCLYPAIEADGKPVMTVEGLIGPGNQLSTVQRAYVEHGGTQCGFCTPGMVMTTVALLESNPDPTESEIIDALAGNLCRCTGYVQIVESIKRAAAAGRREGESR